MTHHPSTLVVHEGHAASQHGGAVNIPPYHASTILFPNLEAYLQAEKGQYQGITYGRYGSPTTQALESMLAKLEGADRAFLTSSGVSAITTAMLAFLKGGDHLLMADTVYGPARRFASKHLVSLGVEVSYYDPMIGAGIAALIRPNTRVVYVESPGSLTMEVQDIPAIAEAAHQAGVMVMADGTWASPTLWRPYELGVDVNVYSATKYVSGHSDLLMGVITCRQEFVGPIETLHHNLGACTNGSDAFLAMRGVRTLPTRMQAHEAGALKVAEWLKTQPEVLEVRHPALSDCPGHEVWKRDFSGSNGLFTILCKPMSVPALTAMLDPLELFGLGYSWGGYESLMIPFWPSNIRTATRWAHEGQCLRLHIGLESPDDLIADLDAGFQRLRKAA